MGAEPLVLAVAAIVGASVGSFLNVCVYRLPRDLSLVSPPSTCPGCGTRIPWYDNVPILGWILLGGRCRRCRAGIAVRYPLVEAAVALVWIGVVWRYGVTLQGVQGVVLLTLLLGIALTDAQHYIIPDEFTWGGLALGLVLSAFGGLSSVGHALLGAAVGFGLLYLVGWAGEKMLAKEAMGGGDIKMMAMVGSFVGWKGALLTIFGGALVGTVIFVPIALKTKKLVPFGIFLAVGGAVAFLAGDVIYAWYGDWVLGR